MSRSRVEQSFNELCWVWSVDRNSRQQLDGSRMCAKMQFLCEQRCELGMFEGISVSRDLVQSPKLWNADTALYCGLWLWIFEVPYNGAVIRHTRASILHC